MGCFLVGWLVVVVVCWIVEASTVKFRFIRNVMGRFLKVAGGEWEWDSENRRWRDPDVLCHSDCVLCIVFSYIMCFRLASWGLWPGLSLFMYEFMYEWMT